MHKVSIYKQFKYIVSIFTLLIFSNIFAQHTCSDTCKCEEKHHDIEVVKITKLQGKDNNKQKLSSTQNDLLNHDGGKFLTSIPEIAGIRKSGSYGTDPVIRGFKYEQLNIVIDGGANAINACPNRMDPTTSQVNMNMVQEAEIYKGPYHFRYGNAFGGTINFVTLPPNFTEKVKLNGRISTGYENNGNITRNEAFTQLTSKKMVWNLFGAYQKGDNYKDGNGDEVRSKFLRYNIGTKINYKWNDKNISAFHVNTNQGRDIDFPALSMNLIYDKTWMFQAKHLVEFQNSGLRQFDFNSYLSLVDHSMGTDNRTMISDVSSKTYGARGELKFNFEKNSMLYSGVDFKHEEAYNIRMVMPAMMPKRDGLSWQDSYIEQLGWFNEFQKNFKTSKLTLSYRLDYNTGDAKDPSNLFKTIYSTTKAKDFNHSFSAGFTKQFLKNSRVSIWLGRAQRSGSITERYINRFAVGQDSYEIVGNPEINPETNNQADLVYTFKKDNFYFQIDGFYSYLQDYISGVIVPIKPYAMSAPGTRQVQNIEKALKTGAEANFKWQFLPNYRTEMAMAYTYGEDVATKNPLPEIAPLDLRWNLHVDFKSLSFAVKYRYVLAQNRINPNFGELKTPEFNLFDLEARTEIFKNASFTLGVYNIFNKAYAEHLSRTLSTSKQQRILASGRSFYLMFSYNF